MNTLNSSELCAVLGGGDLPYDFGRPPSGDNWQLDLLLNQLTRQYEEALRRMMTQGLAD